jgi:hypothetical protein
VDETTRILGILTATATICGTLLWVLYKSFQARVRVWNSVLEPLGGKARPHFGMNAVLSAELPLSNGTRLEIEQWLSRPDNVSSGQFVMTLKQPSFRFSDFFVGADAWASAFARWALRLPKSVGLGASAAAPLNQGRAESSIATPFAVSEALLRDFSRLRVYVLFGRSGWIRLHVPGGTTRPEDTPELIAAIELARAIANAMPKGRS